MIKAPLRRLLRAHGVLFSELFRTIQFSKFCRLSEISVKMTKALKPLRFQGFLYGGRYRTRTCDPLHVKQVLIPAELTVRHSENYYIAESGHCQAFSFTLCNYFLWETSAPVRLQRGCGKTQIKTVRKTLLKCQLDTPDSGILWKNSVCDQFFVIIYTMNVARSLSLAVLTVDNSARRRYNCQQSYSNSVK